MSFRRGSGVTAAFSIVATIAIFGSQQVPGAAAVKAAGPATAAVPATASAASSYRPMSTPFRILDTRRGFCGVNHCSALGQGGTLKLQVTGYVDPRTGGSVPSGATAVVLNVTAVSGTSTSFMTVYPFGTSRPNASNLNFPPGVALANSVTSQLGTGAVSIFNDLGTVQVLADVEGYFTPALASAPAGEYHPIAPIRVCDTRPGTPATGCNGFNDGKPHLLGPNSSVKVQIAGQPAYCATTPCPAGDFIPTDGTEENAIINLTAIAGASNTYLSIVPYLASIGCEFGGNKGAPPYSDINVNAARVQANRVFVPLGPGTTPINVCVYNAVGKANFVIDANGWFGGTGPPPTPLGLQYVATSPTRLCDTRSFTGTLCSGHPLTQRGVLTVTAAGRNGISSSAKAIIANLTAVSGTSGTFLSAYPSDAATRPNVSDVNVLARQVLPNLTAVKLSAGGAFNIFNDLGTINVIVDVEGWFQ